MKAIIKGIALTNFKGIRSFTATFNADITRIYGRNATGKSSIMDAFCWCLFGKDSEGRTTFAIKTKDTNGNEIPRIPHEVVVDLLIDGVAKQFSRCYQERWVRQRGAAEEHLDGHETICKINGVVCNVTDYNNAVSEVCSETLFRDITDPKRFLARDQKEQRATLISMAGGEVSNDEIFAKYPDLKSINKIKEALDQRLARIRADKKRINNEINTIPARIEEQERVKADNDCDFAGVEAEIAQARENMLTTQKRIADEERNIADSNRAADDSMARYNAERNVLVGRINKITNERMAYEQSQRELANEMYADNLKAYNNAIAEQASIDRQLADCTEQLRIIANSIEVKEAEVQEQRDKWSAINAEQYDTFCPHCHQMLPDEMLAEGMAGFKVRQEERKNNCKTIATNIKSNIENLQKQRENMQKQIENLKHNKATLAIPQKPASPADVDFSNDLAWIEINDRLAAANKELEALKPSEISSQKVVSTILPELRNRLAEYTEKVSRLSSMLNKRTTIKAADDRIKELVKQQTESGNELARLEGEEYLILSYNKVRMAMLTDKINALFARCKWRFSKPLVNGGEVDCCECYCDGVEYAAQNTAMRFAMGMDVINALCRYYQVSAPIFVDNAEGINVLAPTESQVVALYVSEDECLTIK